MLGLWFGFFRLHLNRRFLELLVKYEAKYEENLMEINVKE